MAPRKPVKGGPGQWNVGRTGGIGNDSPFKGRDPLSQIASFAWRLPGAIASGRTLQGRKVTEEEWSGLAATAALVTAGIYAGTRGVRGTRPAAGRGAFRSGARPMTTAERSAAVTRGGRTGVGKIGGSIKPSEPRYNQEDGDYPGIASEPFSSYDSAYARAERILSQRGRPSPNDLEVVSGTKVNTRYKGFTETVNIPDAYSDPFDYNSGPSGVDFDMIPGFMKRTLDWKATRAPLRRVASTKKRRVGK